MGIQQTEAQDRVWVDAQSQLSRDPPQHEGIAELSRSQLGSSIHEPQLSALQPELLIRSLLQAS